MPRSISELIHRTDIEVAAQEILDPIQRLKYVRNATATEVKPDLTRRRMVWLGLAAALLPAWSDNGRWRRTAAASKTVAANPRSTGGIPDVWPVEQTDAYDLYSNGLRIENGFTVANEPRSYILLINDSLAAGPRRSQPAGIVFHTTESDQAPFESGQKPALKRIGKEVLLYVRNKRAYHFLIDRFGRVHRVVAESDAANHAGHSIWADARWVYLDLNASFLGVAFEARMGEEPVTEAQINAGRELTGALRSKYHIAAENCVTHAQVSVNPSNMRIGWHTDWGSRFPFREIGLPNNYEIPNPSLYCFGFEYDPVYLNSSGDDVRKSLAAAEEQVRLAAAARGLPMSRYRSLLQQQYQRAQASLRSRSTAQENEDEQN